MHNKHARGGAAMTVHPLVSGDSYVWNNPLGGSWSVAGNWLDSTTGTTATAAPGASNAVTINGGTASYTDITGNGAAASLTVSGDVLQWGTVAVTGALILSGTYGADFELDGAASLSAASVSVTGQNDTLETGGGGKLAISGNATFDGALLTATGASTAQFGTLVMNNGGELAVDGNSSVEVGTTGGAALGAITIDKTASAALSGDLYGNVVVNGTLGVQAGGRLNMDVGTDPFGAASTISGTGTLTMSEGSYLSLGVADSAAIQFNGPNGFLGLSVLPTGTISGFGVGETIELFGLATRGSYVQTSSTVATLTLTKGGQAAGTLTLAGNFTGDLFHVSMGGGGTATITLQTPGTAAPQPSVILGTVGQDYLTATAKNQTLTGLGGDDTLDGDGFAGIDFKDTSANLNGATLNSFDLTDTIDLTDMVLASTKITTSLIPGYYPSYTLAVSDGTHSTILMLNPDITLPIGYFAASGDSGNGTDIKYVVVNTDAYAWSNPIGGGYATAGNWQDTTTGHAATVPPSYGNAVTIAGGATYLDVTGNGAAASLTTSGDVLLSGSLSVGYTVTGVSGALNQTGTLAIGGGANVAFAGTASIGGLVEAEGGTLVVAGTLYGAGGSRALLATGGGVMKFGNVYSYPYYSYSLNDVSVDAVSSIEFGTTGNAVKGAINIDSGVTAALSGGTIYGDVVLNGTLDLYEGPELYNNGTYYFSPTVIAGFGGAAGSITGTGTLGLQGYATLDLGGADSVAISMAGLEDGLALNGALPTGTISGFAQGDTITLAQSVTGLSYTQGSGSGTLTLTNGTTTIGKVTLAGTYAAGQFLLTPAGTSAESTITYLPTPSTTPGAQISTNTDSYSWNNSTGGVWDNAANWSDLTVGGVATAAPGANNAVIIDDSTGEIISGTGVAASLFASGAVFTGNVTVGGSLEGSVISLVGGASMTAGSAYGYFDLSGGSSLTVSGALGGSDDFESQDNGIDAVGGSVAKFAGSGSSILDTFAVDATSSVEFGAAGGAAAGALTVDSGQTVDGGSALDEFGYTTDIAAKVVVNGRLDFVTPSTFFGSTGTGTIEGFGGTVGAVTGTGTVEVDGAVRLVLRVSDSAAIALVTTTLDGTYYPTIELAGPLPTGTISGFSAGDVILVDQPITGFNYIQTSGTLATVNLSDGATAIGGLLLAGNFATSLFHMDVTASTGFALLTLQAGLAAAGTSAISTSKDAYAWVGASGGSWTNAANWHDSTTNSTPTTAPGAGNAVTIAGTTAANVFTTVGAGTAANAAGLAITGNVLLAGTATAAGQLSITQVAGGTALSELSTNAAKLTAATANIAGIMEVGQASTLTVSGTVSLAGTLEADRFSTVKLGALVGSGTIAIDSGSQIGVGSPSGLTNGGLCIGFGATVALSGAIVSDIYDAGTMSVLGGGSLMIDMAGASSSDPYSTTPKIFGSGTIAISEGSTLGLGGLSTDTLQFAGPNATLLLATIPSSGNGAITGFAVGDQIVVDKAVTNITAQIGGSSTTLTLTNGVTTVGTLTLSGNFGGSLAFHLDPSLSGTSATISLLSVGVAAAQPTLITGTAGADLLEATANSQTITGLGGPDTLNGATFSGLDFKDLTANLNGDAIQNFATSDKIDFTDLNYSTASVGYTGGVLSVNDGTHSATLNVAFAAPPGSGSFMLSSDGASGTQAVWHT